MRTTILAPRAVDPLAGLLIEELAARLAAVVVEFDEGGTIATRGAGERAETPPVDGVANAGWESFEATWLRLLSQYAERQVETPLTSDDLAPHLEFTRALRQHGLGEPELLIAIDDAIVPAALGAYAPFLAIVTRLPDGLEYGQPLPGALALALHVAPIVIATNVEALFGLVGRGCEGIYYCPVAAGTSSLPATEGEASAASDGSFKILVSRLPGVGDSASAATAEPSPADSGSDASADRMREIEGLVEVAAKLAAQAPSEQRGEVILAAAADPAVSAAAEARGLKGLKWLGDGPAGVEDFRQADVVVVPAGGTHVVEEDVVRAAAAGKASVLIEGLNWLNAIHQKPVPAIEVAATGDIDLATLHSIGEGAAEWFESERSLNATLSRIEGLARAVEQQPALNTPLLSLQQKREELILEAEVARDYDEKYHAGICYQQIDRELAEIVGQAAAETTQPRILDLGCGPGSLVPFLTQIPGVEVVGVDLSPEMIAVAKARYPEVDFRVGDCEAIPCSDDSFDVVLCSGVLHHLPSLAATFEEIQRVLRPGGAFVMREPSDDHFGSRHVPEATIHLCLRHHLYTTLGRRLVEEPSSHQFHHELTPPALVEALEPWFAVESLRTEMRVAYFYDMIRTARLFAPVERLEASLDNQPGMNVIVVGRLSEAPGASQAVRDRLATLDQRQAVDSEHLELVASAIEWFAERAPSNLPIDSALAAEGWRPALDGGDPSTLVLADDDDRLEQLAAQLPGEGEREFLPLSQAASLTGPSYDLVLVEIRGEAREDDLMAAWRQCRDYGRFYLELGLGARLEGRCEELGQVLVPAIAFGGTAVRKWALRCLSVPMGYTIQDARHALHSVLSSLPEEDEVRQSLLGELEKHIHQAEIVGEFSALRAANAGRTLRFILDSL